MRGLLNYVDPSKGIKWMLGKETSQSYKQKKVAVVYSCSSLDPSMSMSRNSPISPTSIPSPTSPYRPQVDAPVDWVRQAGYELIDLREDPNITIAAAIQSLAECTAETCIIATSSSKLVHQLKAKGVPIEFILAPQEGHAEVLNLNVPLSSPGSVQDVRVLRYRPNSSSLRAALVKAVGKGDAGFELQVDILSDDGEVVDSQEMNEYCPFTPLVQELKGHPETIAALLAVAENLLYRGLEDRYRTLMGGSEKFRETFGVSAALEFLNVLGFEKIVDCEPSPQYVVQEGNICPDLFQKAVHVLNKAIIDRA